MKSSRQFAAVVLALGVAVTVPGCRARTARQTTAQTTAPVAQPGAGAGTQPGTVAPGKPTPPPSGGSSGGGSGGVMGAPGNAAAMDLRRKVDEATAYNQLYQIARFYILFHNDNSRAPSSQQELAEYLKRDANKEYNSLTQGLFVVVPNARLATGSVVAHEREPDRAGMMFAAMGDGSVKKLSAAELQGALQGR